MAIKEYYHSLDLIKVGQLLNTRLHNIADQTAETNLAGTLVAANEGLVIYRTDTDVIKVWTGSAFKEISGTIAGDVIFKGIITNLTNPTVEAVAGSQYVIDANGTLTITGVTIKPSNTVEQGDTLLFTSATEAYVFQRNDLYATDTQAGNIRLSTQAEVNTGTETTEAVTPATLQGKLVAQFYTKQFFGTFNLTAATPVTVTHNLNLTDRDAFTINTMFNNSQVSVDVDSVNTNSLTLTSLVSLTGVKVTVIGASIS